MASLNTLRTKFGVVLSIVIGLALLAFVLSLKTEMGFSGENPTVGKIAGKKIKYSDYVEAYDRVKMQYGESAETNPQQADMLFNTAWQMLISDHVLEPGLDKLGLVVSEQERLDLISGRQPSQTMANAFADRRTGVYDVSAVMEFLAQAETNPQVSRMWNLINEDMLFERSIGKYMGLIKGGVYANSLEAEQGASAANNTYSGRWSGAKYESVPDSLFTLSSSEIRSFYNDHKAMFRQVPSRTISYVVFDVEATSDDMLALTAQANSVGAEFAAAAEVRPFVRANRNGNVSDRYVTAAQMSEAESAALSADKMFGPELRNNIWTMSRVVDVKVAPDTLGIRHIVLPYSEEKLADSLLTALRAGGDFAQAARQHSAYEATAAEGGDTGLTPFSAFTGEFAEALSGVKTGDIVKVASGDAIQLMQIYRAGKPTRHMQIATIEYPVEASSETRRTIHNNAGTFAVNAVGSVEKFNEAVAIAAITPRVGTIAQGERQLQGLEDSREIVRWASDAKVGDVSEIFNVEGDYVIAVLTDIDNDKYKSLKRAEKQVEAEILKEKKYDYIVRNMSGTTFDEVSQGLGNSGLFSGVLYPAFYVQGIGVDPRVVGAITSTAKDGMSAPIKGKTGVYVVQVDQITTEQKQTPEAEKVRVQVANEGMIQQRTLQAIQQMSDMEDLRAKYF